LIDLGRAIEQLRSAFGGALPSHDLSDLFIQTLGWEPPKGLNTADHLNQRCVPIAMSEGVVVWQISLTAKTRFVSALRYQIYTALQQDSLQQGLQSPPLVIFLSADNRRSLWCQSMEESALYVVGSPTTLWQYRLQRLARSAKEWMFPTVRSNGGEAFTELVEGLCSGTRGIDSIAHRRVYSVLTLQRLMFIQQVQQKGWLAGDTWYLQMRFGDAVQKGEHLFFSTCLQPLYRCLSLPEVERPLALQTAIGTVPFLGQLFHTHWLEEKYDSIVVEDSALEAVLGWLSEQANTDTLNPWMAGDGGYWLAQYWVSRREAGAGAVCTPKQAREICDRTLDQLILRRLAPFPPFASSSPQDKTLNDLLFTADSRVCRHLIQEILPTLRILDPCCGSGQLLVAFHQRLTDIFSILTGCIQQTQDAQLKIWHSALVKSNETAVHDPSVDDRSDVILKNIQERVLKNNLYGVAESGEVAASARSQLLLHLVATAENAAAIEPLMDLEFNVMSGNALVGFITVDEERFDQVNKAGADSVLQGNLLQPLAADSYQTILSEKNIALEHYQSRSQLLAKAHSIPPYARAALLREEILTLDSKAQHKLDNLLLSHMSQQLGMRYRETHLIDKPRRRPLMLSDVEQFSPFHWGYHFNATTRRDGFDVVVCVPNSGVLKPTVAEFVHQHEDLAVQKGLSEVTLKTSKRSLREGDAVVAKTWLDYQDQYACLNDFLTRSEFYLHQSAVEQESSKRESFAWEKLLLERCFSLMKSDGFGAVLVAESQLQQDGISVALNLLGEQVQDVERVEVEGGNWSAGVVTWRKR